LHALFAAGLHGLSHDRLVLGTALPALLLPVGSGVVLRGLQKLPSLEG
jgi:hypothetical protein